jgi:DNA-binding IscR family transcriptional regulator
MMDQLDKIIAYEQGDLSEEDTIKLFQELVNSGLVWSLQGHYGRTATRLIEAGLITRPS